MRTKYFAYLFITALMMSLSCRKETIPSEERPVISYDLPIENPPDDFLILFNFNSIGEKSTEISFADTSSWLVEKLGNPRYTLSLFDETGVRVIESRDTLHAKPPFPYRVTVTNTYSTDFLNFFVGFRKLNQE
jgi:hypothetical protein